MQFNSRNEILKLILILPLMASLSACGKSITLNSGETNLTSATVTAGNEIVYPNDRPSVADGAAVWKSQNCASCHAAGGGKTTAASTSVDLSSVDLSSKEYLRKTKPVDQFQLLYFGKPGKSHPVLEGKISYREAWDLVFYMRSLASPPLNNKEIADLDSVFGSNCAVCHGKKGNGDGPLAHNLEPVPANFAQFPRFYDRTDQVLFDHIANGIKWEGMPSFLNKEDKAKNVKFDEEYIWKLVGYVRHFHESTQPTLAANPPEKAQSGENNKAGGAAKPE